MPTSTEARGEGTFGRWALTAVVLLYLSAAALLLVRSEGLPYGLDSNETFSDAIHARNLGVFGWDKSYGLTDESYGAAATAHPYIHSHQGNFPRIYTYLLYILGARSVTTQIVLTTFTIGLAGIVMAFRFFSRSVNPLFAGLACVAYISDYFLFGQWDLNTYRVWHSFFFFSSLLCVLNLADRPSKGAMLLAALNFACLCYWEFVFASFVLVLSALYAVFAARRHPRRILAVWGLELAGALLAASVLLGQLAAYMGLEAVRKDIFYTLHARNSSEEHSFTAQVTDFYARHKVLFWPNYMDVSGLRNPRALVGSLVTRQLEHYTPWLGLSMVYAAAGWALALLSARLFRYTAARFTLACVSLAAASWWFGDHLRWFNLEESSFWAASGGLGLPFRWLVPTGVAGMVALMIAAGPGRVVGESRSGSAASVLALLAAGLLAYAAAYLVFTGYMFSGYLNRQAPLLVFLSDAMLALLAYSFAAPLAEFAERRNAAAKAGILPFRPKGYGWAVLCIALLLALTGGWLRLQNEYMSAVPLDRFAFLKRLSTPPYRGHSFAVNTYAAPVAAETGEWAYMEPVLFNGIVTLTSQGFQIERDPTFKWLADTGRNPAYDKPEYALIIRSRDWGDDFRGYSNPPGSSRSTPDPNELYALYRRASAPFSAYLRDQVVETDLAGGTGTFAIIKLDWDFPAYLRPLPASEILVGPSAKNADYLWNVEIEALPGRQAGGNGVKLISLGTERADVDLANGTEHDLAWGAEGPLRGTLRTPFGKEAWMEAIAHGRDLQISFEAALGSGRVRVRANDQVGDVDLGSTVPRIETLRFSARHPAGELSSRATAVPGQYVSLRRAQGGLELSYEYAQQDNVPEENTRIDLVQRDERGSERIVETIGLMGREKVPVDLFSFRARHPESMVEHLRVAASGDSRDYFQWLADLLSENPDARRWTGVLTPGAIKTGAGVPPASGIRHVFLELPRSVSGSLYALVRPGTRTKLGPLYPSNPVEFSGGHSTPDSGASVAEGQDGNPAYGALVMSLRLPSNRLTQSEPLVTTGETTSGDFIYVSYLDARHVRIGFDHWGIRAFLSKPVEVDYGRTHELVISIGSLFPPDGDILLGGWEPSQVEALKNRVSVKLDGATVLDAASNCFESAPEEVTIGENRIGGSTTGPAFTGQILATRRIFNPTPQ